MKKIVSKFKRWLIKKLGGYLPEERVMLPEPIVRKHNFQPIPLVTETTFDKDYIKESYEGMASANAHFMMTAAHLFANELIQQKLITVSCTEDPCCNGVKYKAKCYVIAPEDMEYY